MHGKIRFNDELFIIVDKNITFYNEPIKIIETDYNSDYFDKVFELTKGEKEYNLYEAYSEKDIKLPSFNDINELFSLFHIEGQYFKKELKILLGISNNNYWLRDLYNGKNSKYVNFEKASIENSWKHMKMDMYVIHIK